MGAVMAWCHAWPRIDAVCAEVFGAVRFAARYGCGSYCVPHSYHSACSKLLAPNCVYGG